MGATFDFYSLPEEKVKEYDYLLECGIEEENLIRWLISNSTMKNIHLAIPYALMDALTVWMARHAISIYRQEGRKDAYYKIQCSKEAKDSFQKLCHANGYERLHPEELWKAKNTPVILLRY